MGEETVSDMKSQQPEATSYTKLNHAPNNEKPCIIATDNVMFNSVW